MVENPIDNLEATPKEVGNGFNKIEYEHLTL
jgi:hypothetical protein